MYLVRAFRLASMLIAAAILVMPAARAGNPRGASSTSYPTYRDATKIRLAPVPDDRVMDHISALLPRSERELMRAVMLQLPRTKRYNVLYFDLNGSIHANSPSILSIARSYKPPPRTQSGVARIRPEVSTGASTRRPETLRAYAYSCTNPPGSTSTGAFRAVYSTCNTPYAFSQVYLPCKSSGDIFLNYPNNEVAFIYEGGFSGKGDAIDAGLQYSWTFDTWAIFMNGDHGSASINPRYQCNQTIPMEFYPVSNKLLAVDVTGYIGDGTSANYVATYAVAFSKGWSPGCARCVVKRVTSLAQFGTGFPSGSDGSYVGMNSSFNPSVRWSNSRVGFWNGRTPVRFNVYDWTASYTGGYRSYPSDSSKVRVVLDDLGGETDGLILQ